MGLKMQGREFYIRLYAMIYDSLQPRKIMSIEQYYRLSQYSADYRINQLGEVAENKELFESLTRILSENEWTPRFIFWEPNIPHRDKMRSDVLKQIVDAIAELGVDPSDRHTILELAKRLCPTMDFTDAPEILHLYEILGL
jgi:hypothetical protein